MSLAVFLMIVGAVLALPGGLFIAYLLSLPRARVASLLGGIIGDGLTALGAYYFVRADHVNIDGLSYWFGVFFAATIGTVIGALIADFLVGARSRGGDANSMEY